MAQVAPEVEGVARPPAGTYQIDVAHTAVEFVARHMLAKVRGRFTGFSGTIELAEEPEDSSVDVRIEASSIQTNAEQRDQHLRGPDFLDVERYPTLSFRSTAVRVLDGAGFELDGELTIRDVTRRVTLRGEYLGLTTSPYGQTVIAASARTTIEREDWAMTWNVALEAGGWLVGRKVDLEIEVEAILQDG